MALMRLGIGSPLVSGDGATGTIAATTSTSLDADLCKSWYPIKRDELAESYPWPFLLKYADLVLSASGTGQVWGSEWEYAYTYPSDCARLWRFARTSSDSLSFGTLALSQWLMQVVSHEDPNYQYAIRSVGGVKLIMSHLEAARARMIYAISGAAVSQFSNEYASALAWSIAMEIAPALTQGDMQKADYARQMFHNITLPMAISTAQNEQDLLRQQDGDFVRARWG